MTENTISQAQRDELHKHMGIVAKLAFSYGVASQSGNYTEDQVKTYLESFIAAQEQVELILTAMTEAPEDERDTE